MLVGPGETRRVIVLGAARSGTKVLRDALGEATGAGTVPYDVPFVWYQGSAYPDSDDLDPRLLKHRTAARIRDYIDSYAEGRPPVVIEKTVGNTLRVPYVSAVLPGAAFVHLVRDGVDVVESTYRQWREPTDVAYLRDKVRHTPKRLLPTYGARYVRSALSRFRGGTVRTWGVRYPGMQRDLQVDGLLRVCARQWRAAVEGAAGDLDTLPLPHVDVRYEDLVADPAATLERVATGCGLSVGRSALASASARISGGMAGRGRSSLTAEELEVLQEEIGPTLARLGYSSADSRR